MTAPLLGSRDFHLNLGSVVGAIVGTFLMLPCGLWPNAPVDLPLALPVGATFGSVAGLAMAAYQTTLSDGRRWIARGPVFGALAGCAVGAICYAREPNPTPNPWPTMFPLLFALMGAFLGLIAGVLAAERIEIGEHEACRRKLASQQAELEADIVERFGPLDEARRAMIQTWDADRLAEARRKLDDARSVEELVDA
jgi:hypothetical protein